MLAWQRRGAVLGERWSEPCTPPRAVCIGYEAAQVLHPQPGEWETLESYVRRLAQAYGVSYGVFLRCALGHAGPGARDLLEVPDELLARLSAGKGVPARRLRGMVGWSMMARLSRQAREWLGMPEDREAAKKLRVTIMCRQRRMPASRGP